MPNTSSNKYLFHSQISRDQGYTLIEVLIAVVILSIGLLGMAGIQVKGMRGTQNTFLKTTATNLAQSMAERIHANPIVADKVEDTISGRKFYMITDTTTESCATVLSCNGTSANCTPEEVVAADIYEWVCGTPTSTGTNIGGINNSLPNGSGSISCTDKDTTDADVCSPGSTRTITISWDESALNPDKDAATNDEIVTRSIVLNTVP